MNELGTCRALFYTCQVDTVMEKYKDLIFVIWQKSLIKSASSNQRFHSRSWKKRGISPLLMKSALYIQKKNYYTQIHTEDT